MFDFEKYMTAINYNILSHPKYRSMTNTYADRKILDGRRDLSSLRCFLEGLVCLQ